MGEAVTLLVQGMGGQCRRACAGREVGGKRGEGEARGLVGVVVAVDAGAVAGVVFEAVDHERAAVAERVGEHQAARDVPVARVPVEGVGAEEG